MKSNLAGKSILVGSKPTIPIAFCIAGDYWRHAAVAIYSASRFASNLDFHLFYEADNSRWRIRIKEIIKSHGNSIEFHHFDTSLVQGFREMGYLGLGTYFRIFLVEIFPDAKRILYLDSDLVVMDNLELLLNWEMGDFAVAARPSCERGLTEMCARKLGKSIKTPYLNAGVLLIDVEKWRAQNLTRKISDFIKSQPEKLTYADQCAINYVLDGSFAFLRPEWNTSHGDWRFAPSDDALHFSRFDLEHAMSQPKIIHYNGPRKPWELRDTHERKHEYRRFRRCVEPRFLYIADDFPRAVSQIVFEKILLHFRRFLFFLKKHLSFLLNQLLHNK
jgi:lipopolysaccharide biosynthesis glycosyltransferase